MADNRGMRSHIHIRKSFLRKLFFCLLTFIALMVIYGQVGNSVLKPIAVRQIEAMTSGRVDISEVKFRISGKVEMNYVGVTTAGAEDYDNRVLKAARVDIYFSPWSLLRFSPKIKRITVEDFFVNAQYDVEEKSWNLGFLNSSEFSGDKDVPIIRAQKGILKYSEIRDGLLRDVVIVGISGTFSHTQGKPNEYGFFIEADPRLGFGGSSIHGVWKAGKEGGNLRILDSQLYMNNSPVLSNLWFIDSLNLDLTYTKDSIEDLWVRFSMGEDTTAELRGGIEDLAGQGKFDFRITAQNVFLNNELTPNALVYSSQTDALIHKDLRSFLAQFQPRGWGHVDIRVSGTLDDIVNAECKGVLDTFNVTLMDEHFPYLLENLRGRLEISEKGSRFERLECSHKDVDLVLSGYAYGGSEALDLSLVIESPNMRLDSDLHNALDEKQKELWLTFTPEGQVAIRYETRKRPFEEKQDSLEVELTGTRAVYSHFPYELVNLTGHLSMDPNEILLKDVRSWYEHPQGDYHITLNGRITEIGSEKPRFNIVIDANDVPIDERLMVAMPAQLQDFYEKFELDARTQSRIKVFPNEVGKRDVEYIAWVKVRGAQLAYEKLPLRWTDVDVDAILTPDLVRLEHVRARSGPGTLTASGKVWPVNETNETLGACLHLDAQSIEINEDILMALPQRGESILEHVETSGPIDVAANLNLSSKDPDCREYEIFVRCLGNRLVYDKVGYPLENITGEVLVKKDRIEIRELTSRMEHEGITQEIRVSGEVLTDENAMTSADLSLKGRDIAIDDRLMSAFLKMDTEAVSRMSAGGRLDISTEKVHIEKNDKGGLRAELAGTASVTDGRFGRGLVTRLKARATGSAVLDLEGRLLSARADYYGSGFDLKGQRVEGLRGQISYDPDARAFISDSFTANLYGGRLIGDFSARQSGPDGRSLDYLIEVVFDGVNVAAMLEKDQDGRASYPAGMAQGSFTLTGSTETPGSGVGRFNAEILGMQFAQRTLAGKVVSAAKVKEPSPHFQFDTILVESYVQHDRLVFEEVLMRDGSSVLRGSGGLDLDSNQLDITFQAFGQKMTQEPSFVDSLLAVVSPAIIQIHVTGTTDRPRIKTQTLSVLNAPGDLLGPKKR